MFQLTIQPRSGETRSYLLDRGRITLGGGPDCDVVIASPFVAPLVARLEWEEGHGFRLTAAPGQRSLTVNGQPVISALLKDGDQIRTGEFVCNLHACMDAPSAPLEDGSGRPSTELSRTEELEEVVLRQLAELNELRPLRASLAESERHLEQALAALEDTRISAQSAGLERSAERQQAAVLATRMHQEHGQADARILELQERLLALEHRLQETEADARRRIERARETIATLRKAVAQQDVELREQRQNLLKLQQAKNAAETQLDSLRKSYSRDRKQHGRLVDQFRERARRETARADMALDELARARESSPPQQG